MEVLTLDPIYIPTMGNFLVLMKQKMYYGNVYHSFEELQQDIE